MLPAEGTTPKAQQQGTNNGESESFRVLYYGSASAGSVPFMWESQPGTPKHALTESSLPPLTPPPSYQQFNQRYNSSMQVIGSSKRSGFFRNFFLDSSRKWNTSAPLYNSGSSSSSSSMHSWRSTPMEVRRGMVAEGGGGSPTSTLCFGGEFKKSYRVKKMKNAIVSFVRNGRRE